MDFAKHIQPLSSKSDWPIWKRRIEDLLDYHEGAIDVIKGNLTKPQQLGDRPTKSQRSKFKTASDLYRKANSYAKSLISCTVSNSVYQKIMDNVTAYETWEALKQEFEATSTDQSLEITNNTAPTGTVTSSRKEWHKEITSEQREKLVQKLIDSINSHIDATGGNSASLPVGSEGIQQNVGTFARKVENDAYDAANSKPEYYNLLAEKYYKLSTALVERRQKKKEQQRLLTNQQQQQQPPQMTQLASKSETLQQNQLTRQPIPQTSGATSSLVSVHPALSHSRFPPSSSTANPSENFKNQLSNSVQSSQAASQPTPQPQPTLSQAPQPQQPPPHPIQSSSEASQKQYVDTFMQSLIHAVRCCDTNCQVPMCKNMKLVVQHVKICKDSNCAIPLCSWVKQKMKIQQPQQRVQQQQLLPRQMATMTSQITGRIRSPIPTFTQKIKSPATASIALHQSQKYPPHTLVRGGEPSRITLTPPSKDLQASKQSQCSHSLAEKNPNISEKPVELEPKSNEQLQPQSSESSSDSRPNLTSLEGVPTPRNNVPPPTSPPAEKQLKPEVLELIGLPANTKCTLTPKFDSVVCSSWESIARSGLPVREELELIAAFPPPENCSFLDPPTRNEALEDLLTDESHFQDNCIVGNQQLLGAGLSALSQGISELIQMDNDALLPPLKKFCSAAKMFAGGFCKESILRRDLILSLLDPELMEGIAETEVTDQLFRWDFGNEVKQAEALTQSPSKLKAPESTTTSKKVQSFHRHHKIQRSKSHDGRKQPYCVATAKLVSKKRSAKSKSLVYVFKRVGTYSSRKR